MAISAYHRSEDLWTLAKCVRSIRDDYKFAFRHYRVDCHDYNLQEKEKKILIEHGLDLLIPSVWEMVLYCK